MLSEKFDLKGLFGIFGVGALLILGCFFILNGTIEIWDIMEEAANLKGWNIFVSIPLIVVAYIFGIISIEFADLILHKKGSIEQECEILKVILARETEVLQNLYFENLQTQRLLKGGFIAFIFVAIGSIIEGVHWGTIGILGIIGGVGAFCLSVLCMILAKKVRQKFENIITTLNIKEQ